MAARQLETAPEDCLVFEDAEAGIKAARRAGMKAMGVGNEPYLKSADMVITGFENIDLKTLKGLFPTEYSN